MSNCPWCRQDVEQAVLAEAANLRGIALDDVDDMLYHAEHDEVNDMPTVVRVETTALRELEW